MLWSILCDVLLLMHSTWNNPPKITFSFYTKLVNFHIACNHFDPVLPG